MTFENSGQRANMAIFSSGSWVFSLFFKLLRTIFDYLILRVRVEVLGSVNATIPQTYLQMLRAKSETTSLMFADTRMRSQTLKRC